MAGRYDDVTPPLDSSSHTELPHVEEDDRHVRKKPKTTAVSSRGDRGVASLTPEQLAKKRAVDREAQRAIRERTKGQIEKLELQVKELTAQQPYQDLQAVIRQKDAIQADNDELKWKLASVIQTLQSCIGSTGSALPQTLSHALPTAPVETPSRPPPGPGVTSSYPSLTPLRTKAIPNPSPQSPYSSSPHQLGLPISNQPQGAYPTSTSAPGTQHETQPRAGHTAGEKLDLGFVLGPSTQSSTPPSKNPVQQPPQIHPSQIPPLQAPPPQIYPSTPSPPYNILHPSPEFYNSGLSAHNAPLRNSVPTCPLDTLLLDFRRDQHQRLIQGVRLDEIMGPAYPSFSSLIEPERSRFAHPLSRIHTNLLAQFPHLCDLPEQVAVLYIMFLTMRWTVSRTPATYDDMPDWITPRPSQLLTPHPAWMDNLPWPKMRDKMVVLYPEFHFDDFFIPYTIGLSLNWKAHPADVLLKVEGQEDLRLNPDFERHLRDLSNWTLGPEFVHAFPKLEGTCPIKEKPTYIP